MRVRNKKEGAEKIELQMTPMIDIVFQLLVFFIMTFKIVALEGDFNIKMPLSAPSEGLPDDKELAPFRLRMTATSTGELKSIKLDQQSIGSSLDNAGERDNAFDTLHKEIIARLGDDRGPGSLASTAEVELVCDYDLDYKYVIAAITAVSGYPDKANDGKIIKLVEKIKFAQPVGAPSDG